MNPHLSIVIPAYKEEKRIGRTLAAVAQLVPELAFPTEVIVVDDGSPDGTISFIERYAEKHQMPYLRVLPLGTNHGKGFAVKTGMQAARGAFILFMDADNSTDVRKYVQPFLKEAYAGTDVVIASIEVPGARAKQDNGVLRDVLGKLSKMLIRTFAAPGILDTQRGFKLFSRRAADTIFPLQTIDRFGFDFEIMTIALRQGMRVREMPIVWNNPDGSTVRSRDYIISLFELMRVAFNKLIGMYDRRPDGATAQGLRPA